MSDLLSRAIAIAAEAHAGQVDKAGQPYILHPLRVMLAVKTPVERIAAVLHDVAEDCPDWSLARIIIEGELGPSAAAALQALTKPPDRSYQDYIALLAKSGSIARVVKIADIRDNLDPSRAASLPDSLRQRYEQALAQLENAHAR